MIGEKNQGGDVESGRVQARSGSGSEQAQNWCGPAPGRANIGSRASVPQGGKASEWRGLGTELKGQRLLIQRLGRLKTSSTSAPCLGAAHWSSGPNEPPAWYTTTRPPETLRRTRLSLRIRTAEEKKDGVGLSSGSSLPPIYGSKITPQNLEQPAPRLTSDPVRDKGGQGREKPSPQARPATQAPNRKLFRRQEVSVQRAGVRLVRSSVSVLNRCLESPNPGEAAPYRGQKSDVSPGSGAKADPAASPDKHESGAQGNKRGSDERAATGQRKLEPEARRTRAQENLCSHDSAIDSDSQSSESDDEEEDAEEEEEYYTDQRIGEWVVTVNASLFSPSNGQISFANHLEEEDVDTIKIIYEQDKKSEI